MVRRLALLFGVVAAVVVADQVTKALVRGSATLPWWPVESVGISMTRNTGVSFGALAGHDAAVIVLVSVVCVVVAVLVVVMPSRYGPPLALVLGGALGNLTDRVRDGWVTDFVHVGPWPPFNVADAAIAAGVCWLVWVILFPGRPHASRSDESGSLAASGERDDGDAVH